MPDTMPSPLNCPVGSRVLLGLPNGPYTAMTIGEWSACQQYFQSIHDGIAGGMWHDASQWKFHAHLHQPGEKTC